MLFVFDGLFLALFEFVCVEFLLCRGMASLCCSLASCVLYLRIEEIIVERKLNITINFLFCFLSVSSHKTLNRVFLQHLYFLFDTSRRKATSKTMKTTIPKALFVVMTMEVVLTTTFATQGKGKLLLFTLFGSVKLLC